MGRVTKQSTCTVEGTLPENESGFDALTYTAKYEYVYNASGNLYKYIDHIEGAEYYFEYDADGRIRNQWKCDLGDADSLELSYTASITYQDKSLISSTSESFLVNGEVFTNKVFLTYDSKDRLSEYAYNSEDSSDKITYSYDGADRITSLNVSMGNFSGTSEYEYIQVADPHFEDIYTETGLISKYTSTVKHNGTTLSETEYNYTYDERGNITQITNASGVVQNRFFYDDLGQLIREDNRAAKRTLVWDYDDAGNIVRKRVWNVKFIDATAENDYSELGTPSYDYAYTYGNSEWGDLLTKYRGGNITYDEIGNPLSYYDGRRFYFEWEGRQLKQLTLSSVVTTFEYNSEGLRTNKTTGGVSHDYIWSGDRLLAEVTDDYILKFFYDASGNVLGFEYLTPTTDANGNTDYTGTTYYYEKNIFGDVVAIYDENGTKVGAYGFNSFGQNNVVTNLTDDNIASLNPIRYRSYYYDTDIYLYYLQSRYYDPVTCRFINADSYASTGQGLLGNNMFAYCSNNSVMCKQIPLGSKSSITNSSTSIIGSTINLIINSSLSAGGSAIRSNSVAKSFSKSLSSVKPSGLGVFGYELRTSAGWNDSDTIATSFLGRVGLSSYITHTQGQSGVLYAFAGSTADVMNWNGVTYYTGLGINLFDIIGAEVQLETLGIGAQVSIGNLSVGANINLIGGTSITLGWNTDLGNGVTRTDGITVEINTGLLVAVVLFCYKFVTTGDTTPVPGMQPA